LPTCLVEELVYDIIGEENIAHDITISRNNAECTD